MSLILLCLPGSDLPNHPFFDTIHLDKWVHVILFFGLCFLFSNLFITSVHGGKPVAKPLLVVMCLGIVYGTLMEFVQKYWIPGRTFDVFDIAADSVGCVLGYVYSRKKWAGRV